MNPAHLAVADRCYSRSPPHGRCRSGSISKDCTQRDAHIWEIHHSRRSKPNFLYVALLAQSNKLDFYGFFQLFYQPGSQHLSVATHIHALALDKTRRCYRTPYTTYYILWQR